MFKYTTIVNIKGKDVPFQFDYRKNGINVDFSFSFNDNEKLRLVINMLEYLNSLDLRDKNENEIANELNRYFCAI